MLLNAGRIVREDDVPTRTRKRATASRTSGRSHHRKVAKTRTTRPRVTPEDEAAYIESLIASGEAARPDEHGRLPAGATHAITEDEAGKVKVVRRRFSIT